jgi:acyl carrier protein
MTGKNIEPEAVWVILWEALDGSVHDVAALKASARDDAHFIDDMGLDSLDLLEFYLRLNENFGVSLTEDDYPELVSVNTVASFLETRASAP